MIQQQRQSSTQEPKAIEVTELDMDVVENSNPEEEKITAVSDTQ